MTSAGRRLVGGRTRRIRALALDEWRCRIAAVNDVATLEVLIGDTPPYPLAEPACAGQVARGHAPVHGPRADGSLYDPGNHRAHQR